MVENLSHRVSSGSCPRFSEYENNMNIETVTTPHGTLKETGCGSPDACYSLSMAIERKDVLSSANSFTEFESNYLSLSKSENRLGISVAKTNNQDTATLSKSENNKLMKGVRHRILSSSVLNSESSNDDIFSK